MLDELRERLGTGGLALLDVRSRPEFDGLARAHCDPRHGHIPGAANLPLERIFECRDAEQVREVVGLPAGAEIVAYCHTGQRSAVAAQILREVGYAARNYRGSWHEWSREVPTDAPAATEYRPLEPADLAHLGDIDRTEWIDTRVVQHGLALEELAGDWSASAWSTEDDGEHSVVAQQRECEKYLSLGGRGVGAWVGARLVGIGIVRPDVRPGVAQLAYLHVSLDHRGRGVGGTLSAWLERVASETGHTAIVVSATPSQSTVRFYLARGYEPMVDPIPELLELEPEDVHLSKPL
jgi:rhodanese-related sulfurtransferase/predicted N-acetyltransferase YhbS